MIVLNSENFETRITSVTVRDDEISIIQLNAGERIFLQYSSWNGKFWEKKLSPVEYETPVTLVVDRLSTTKKGQLYVTGIRQEVEGHNIWQCWANPDKYFRHLCESRGAKRVTVPGGMPPIVQENEIAIPDFNMSGTSWYLMPVSVYDTIWETREREKESRKRA